MKIITKTKNLELSGAFGNFIEKKFLRLKKFINFLKRDDEIGKTLAEVFVEVEKETKHHRKGDIFIVKAKIQLPGRMLMARVKSEDLLKAVVKAKDELEIEIKKYKFRIIDNRRRAQRKIKRSGVI